MAKTKFTIAQACRIEGKHYDKGDTIELDVNPDATKQVDDTKTLGSLLGSNRIVHPPGQTVLPTGQIIDNPRPPRAVNTGAVSGVSTPAEPLTKAEQKAADKADAAADKADAADQKAADKAEAAADKAEAKAWKSKG